MFGETNNKDVKITLLPIILASLGGFHTVASRDIKKLASVLARHTGEEEGVTIRKCFVRLSVLLIKCNTAILSNIVPSLSDTFAERSVKVNV